MKRTPGTTWKSVIPSAQGCSARSRSIIEGEGAEVELEENIDAFIHISNIFWNQPATVAEALKVGEKKEFKIVDVDKSRYSIMLGLKTAACLAVVDIRLEIQGRHLS